MRTFSGPLLAAVSLLLLTTVDTLAEDTRFTESVSTTAASLREAGLADTLAYELVESLTTEVGPRLAGTQAEARARDWAVAKLSALGFENVRVEPFTLPVWTRGIERAEIVSPFPQPLRITALGGSSSTGAAGVSGPVVRFDSLADLNRQPEGSLTGKIVFVDEVMTRTQDGSGYGVAVAKRRNTAYEAERLGAVGALIRSVGTSSHRFPHAGQMRRATETGAAGVPTAALSAPDADQLGRALARGNPVTVKLTLTPETRPAGKSGNVIAEIPGREAPGEIVLVGAHLDAWDLGTGAVDDGAGVGIVVAAAKLVQALRPRRTVRVVLFGSEEVGLVGAHDYATRHAAELDRHIVAAESDFGADRIWRFDTRFDESKRDLAQAIAALLKPLGIGPGNNTARGGPDIGYLRNAGVPVVTLYQNGWDYFDLHHTPDDTLDKIDPAALAQNVAAYAAFIYIAAEMPGHFRAD
ncbi:MAG: M20/M25/M40 family metallo-hydrolase [Halieaceae bacterium]|jgi:hypothetical protein|nr:M20/M25/M40 family metallo-hydrolase [Halieaceae bacterium]